MSDPNLNALLGVKGRGEPYALAALELGREVGVTVRKWRTQQTGCAYTKSADWGIESPLPVGPMSFAVFAHEVGHQDLHRRRDRPRWVEETEAHEYALAAMERFRLAGADSVRERSTRRVAYAFAKAVKRGVKPSTIRARFPEWWADATQTERYAGQVLRAAERKIEQPTG